LFILFCFWVKHNLIVTNIKQKTHTRQVLGLKISEIVEKWAFC
jgi:hypothetical protein